MTEHSAHLGGNLAANPVFEPDPELQALQEQMPLSKHEARDLDYRDAMEQQLPEITDEVLARLNVQPLNGVMNQELTDGFRKEGVVKVHDTVMRVVDSAQGTELLKNFRGYGSQHDVHYPKLAKLEALQTMQREVAAYRVAEVVGYPIAPTRLVTMDGRPWIAYEYMPDVMEYSPDFVARDPDTEAKNMPFKGELTNPHMEAIRPLFNALVDAYGDSASQGMVQVGRDGMGTYYANDIMINLQPDAPNVSEEHLYDDMADAIQDPYSHGGYYRYGHELAISSPNRTEQDVENFKNGVRVFRAGLERITPGVAEGIFADQVGSMAARSAMAHQLVQRAKVLLDFLPEVR